MKKINTLNKRPKIQNKKTIQRYTQFISLLALIRQRQLSNDYIDWINDCIQEINATPDDEKAFKSILLEKQYEILKLLEKDLKIVTKRHYQNTWMLIGMVFIGIPLGIFAGYTLKNIELSILGIPLGYAIGMLIGIFKDKKVEKENRQLDILIKY